MAADELWSAGSRAEPFVSSAVVLLRLFWKGFGCLVVVPALDTPSRLRCLAGRSGLGPDFAGAVRLVDIAKLIQHPNA